jgi:hypothetical protein
MKEIPRMNRTFAAVCGAVVVSTALIGAQGKPAGEGNSGDNSNSASAATVTFTGCLNPGSNSDSFYLTSAKQKGVKNADKSIKILPASDKVKLEQFLTREVEVTGTIDQVESAPADKADAAAKARTLTVTKAKVRNDSCG